MVNNYYRLKDGMFVKSDIESKRPDEYIISLANANKLLSGLTDKVVDNTLVDHDTPKVIVSNDSKFKVNLEVLDNLNVVKHVYLTG